MKTGGRSWDAGSNLQKILDTTNKNKNVINKYGKIAFIAVMFKKLYGFSVSFFT